MSTLLKSRQRNWIAATCLLCVLVPAAPACWAAGDEKPPAAASNQPAAPAKAAAPAAPTEPATELPAEVPPDIWDAFLKAFREDEMYQLASQLKAAEVKAAIDKWSKELGIEIVPQTETLIAYNGGQGEGFSVNLPGPGMGFRLFVTQELNEGDAPGQGAILEVYSGAAQEKVYSVPADKRMEPLAFQFSHGVRLVAPLERRLSEFRVQGQPLIDVVATLAKEADADYSMCSGSNVFMPAVTLCVRNRSVQDILRIATDSVGGQVDFFVGESAPLANGFENKDGKPGYLKAGAASRAAMDFSVEFSEMRAAYRSRAGLKIIGGLKEPIATPLDAMKYLVFKRAREIREQRPVVVVVLHKAAP